MSLKNMPNEIVLEYILPQLDSKSLYRLHATCRKVRKLCEIDIKRRYMIIIQNYLKMNSMRKMNPSYSHPYFTELCVNSHHISILKHLVKTKHDRSPEWYVSHYAQFAKFVCHFCCAKLVYPHPFYQNVRICYDCSKNRPSYHMISKSSAIKLYGLTEQDLFLIHRLEKHSPFSKTSIFYLEEDLLELVDDIYGSFERMRMLTPRQRSSYTKLRRRKYQEFEEEFREKVLSCLIQTSGLTGMEIELLMQFAYPLYRPIFWGIPSNNTIKKTKELDEVVVALLSWIQSYRLSHQKSFQRTFLGCQHVYGVDMYQ